MFKKIKYYKDVVGKRQIYRRIAEEVSQTVDFLEMQPSSVPTISKDSAENTCIYNQDIYLNFTSNVVHDSLVRADVSEEFTAPSEIGLTTSPFETYTGFNQDKNLLNRDGLVSNLQQCSLTNRVPHKALSELLHILHSFHSHLPLDARTLLKTPSIKPKYKKLETGEYIHLGLTKNIIIFLRNNPNYKSNIIQMWQRNYVLQLVFCGKSKPASLTFFLEDFISELKHLVHEGLHYKSKMYRIGVHSYICDAPAKAFKKCTRSHSGYSSCDKYTVIGGYVNGRCLLGSSKKC